ncbi:MAG: cold shock domain-containing protein, partial [Flavobacterium sp.]|nr:cold shock domain-containing protein [Flavobacterium sp.]
KKKEKQEKKEARKANPKLSGEDLYVYVDENGHLTSTPPDPSKKIIVDVESIEIGIPKREEQEAESPFKEGIVDFYDTSKGFGFIKELDSDNKFFFHVKGLIDEVKEGNKVTYELEKGMKGMNAVRVKKI